MSAITDSHSIQASEEVPLPTRNESGKFFGVPADVPSEIYFHLLEQPHEKQRKSYKNENRHLLPNPLIIAPKVELANTIASIEGGICTVRLVYENGEELPERLREKDVLGGQTVCPLDMEHKASFTLKVLETSERKFRLLFLVQCAVNGQNHLEYVLSHPFLVSTNKKRPSIEPPLVFDVKPREIKFNKETELWIKGRNFCERELTQVTVGGKPARITETEDNLITCVIPHIEPTPNAGDLPVEVSTFHPNKGKLIAENRPIVTFKMKLERRVKKPQTEPQSIRVTVPSPKVANRFGYMNPIQTFPIVMNPQNQLSVPSTMGFLNAQPFLLNTTGTSAQLVGLPTPQPTSQMPTINRSFIPQTNYSFQPQSDNRGSSSNDAANRFIRQMDMQGRVVNTPVSMQTTSSPSVSRNFVSNRNIPGQQAERMINDNFQNAETLVSERRASNEIFSLDPQRISKESENIERRQSLSDILSNEFMIENFDANLLNNVQKRNEL